MATQPIPCTILPHATVLLKTKYTLLLLVSSLGAAPRTATQQEYIHPLILLTISHRRAQYRQTAITSIYLASILVKLKIKIKTSLHSY